MPNTPISSDPVYDPAIVGGARIPIIVPVPAGGWSDGAITVSDLLGFNPAGDFTVSGDWVFVGTIDVPDNALSEASITGLTTDLAARALDSAVVKLTGNQTIAGIKTFSSPPVIPFVPTGSIAATTVAAAIAEVAAEAGTGTGSDLSGLLSNTGGGKDVVATANASGAVTVNLNNGNVHVLTLTGNVTSVTITNATNGAGCAFELHWVQGATPRTVAYGSAWKWAGGTAPVMSTANGARDRVVGETLDGGSTVYGDLVGQAYA